MSYQYLQGISSGFAGMGTLGQNAPAVPVEKTPTLPEIPVEIPVVRDPAAVLSKKEVVQLSDSELTDKLNDAISEGWRLKGCDGAYCAVRAVRNRQLRVALLADYRRRQMEREMPPIEEPIHTLAYGRYKLSKTVLNWADQTLTGRMLWPVKVYTKAGATALEDIVGSKYLTAFIVSSPIFGVWMLRHAGFTGLGWTLAGGYLGMTVGALLPIGLFALSQMLGAGKEEDFIWAVS